MRDNSNQTTGTKTMNMMLCYYASPDLHPKRFDKATTGKRTTKNAKQPHFVSLDFRGWGTPSQSRQSRHILTLDMTVDPLGSRTWTCMPSEPGAVCTKSPIFKSNT